MLLDEKNKHCRDWRIKFNPQLHEYSIDGNENYIEASVLPYEMSNKNILDTLNAYKIKMRGSNFKISDISSILSQDSNMDVDNDQYIFDNAFKPFRHYSADFVVKFWDSSPDLIESNRKKVKQYYDNHSDFFINKDLPWGHPYLASGAIPLADLVDAPENYLEILSTHQYVKDVYFI
jgi:hypothetical protein